MSIADIIILIVVILLVAGIITYLVFTNRQRKACSVCSYAKNCETFCHVTNEKDPKE
ncbi:MAG: hypothetical protein ACOX3C_01160 [Bacilli bacterium]|jgi:uncharacterized protein (UPF0333 family)